MSEDLLIDAPEMDQLVDEAVAYLLRNLKAEDHWPDRGEIACYRAGFRSGVALAAGGDLDVILEVLEAYKRNPLVSE